MTEQPYNEEDLNWARSVMQQYLQTALHIISELCNACRADDGVTGGRIVHQIHEAHDEHLLMMVIGQLVTQLVAAQRRATEAHGPLMTPQELGYSEGEATPAPWQTGLHDQIAAAAADNDHQEYARLAVNGQVNSIVMDMRQAGLDEPNLTEVVRGMMLVPQETLTLLASEMLCRLSKHALAEGKS